MIKSRFVPGTHKVSELIDLKIIDIGDGYRAKNSEMSAEGMPFARAGNINDGFHFESADKLGDEGVAKAAEKISMPGDVLFTSKGTVGRFALVKEDTPQFVYSPQLCYWRSKEHSIIYPKFLYYWMSGPGFISQINSVKGQTDMADYVNLRDQRMMHIQVPPLPVQHQIAAILSAFDDKIELNRQMNRTLEQMARALFKSWFIDFDPVHAKQRGEQPEGMDAETAALFPDRFVEIDGKEVPEGWAYGSVSDIAQQVKNQMNPSDHPDALFAHFSIPAFDASGRPAIERGSEIKSNKFVVPDAALLVSKLNPATPRIWDTDLSDDAEYRVSSTEFIPLVTRSGELRAFLYLALTSHDFAKALSGQASGTSNSHQRVKPSDILSAPVLLAPPQIIAAFSRLAIPILDHAKRNLREINQLAGTRDSLLPRLLSGELDVSDWETAVEAPEGAPT